VAFDLYTFHREAVTIPSHEDVDDMKTFLLETLSSEGADPIVDEVGNVLVTRRSGNGNGPHLVLNTHIDTVPPHVSYERNGDIVRGRGSCDAKGSLAAMLDAFLTAQISRGTLTLAITPDEETAQRGGAHLGETLSADGYIVGEPTGLDVCVAAKGNFGGRVHIHGESAHASDPSAGVNALQGVGPLLNALEKYDKHCGPGPHDLLGSPTLTPTRIESGGPLNQVPDTCTVSFDRRTVPPETIDGFLTDLDSYLAQQLPEQYDFKVKAAYPDSPDPDAFATDSDSDLVQALVESSGGSIHSFDAATEASYFADDAPTVVFGPGVLTDEDGPVAHADREYIHRDEMKTASAAIRNAVETLLS
jgi:acetylornithine deacetylase